MSEATYWIGCSASLRPTLENLGVHIGREVKVGVQTDTTSYRDCFIPDEAIDPMFDLWNETKLMFGYEEDEPQIETTIEAIHTRYKAEREVIVDIYSHHLGVPKEMIFPANETQAQSPPATRRSAAIRRT